MVFFNIQSSVDIAPQCKEAYKLKAIVLQAQWDFLVSLDLTLDH